MVSLLLLLLCPAFPLKFPLLLPLPLGCHLYQHQQQVSIVVGAPPPDLGVAGKGLCLHDVLVQDQQPQMALLAPLPAYYFGPGTGDVLASWASNYCRSYSQYCCYC